MAVCYARPGAWGVVNMPGTGGTGDGTTGGDGGHGDGGHDLPMKLLNFVRQFWISFWRDSR